jgi:hypothetical protein
VVPINVVTAALDASTCRIVLLCVSETNRSPRSLAVIPKGKEKEACDPTPSLVLQVKGTPARVVTVEVCARRAGWGQLA